VILIYLFIMFSAIFHINLPLLPYDENNDSWDQNLILSNSSKYKAINEV
jgi:hypothetical protein